jgi:hypothetical protein
VSANPVEDVSRLNKGKKRLRFLSDDERKALLAREGLDSAHGRRGRVVAHADASVLANVRVRRGLMLRIAGCYRVTSIQLHTINCNLELRSALLEIVKRPTDPILPPCRFFDHRWRSPITPKAIPSLSN